jgi:DNA-directed RNA polymerase subunit N (RpoN/RPB10)
MTFLPERVLSKIDPADRKAMGAAGKTMPEHIAEYSAKLERTLHNDYLAFLRRNGFKDHQIIHASMSWKSHLPVGHPDFLITHGGKFLYIEFKVGANTLDPAQELVIADLIAHGCCVRVLYSHSEAINETIKYFNL